MHLWELLAESAYLGRVQRDLWRNFPRQRSQAYRMTGLPSVQRIRAGLVPCNGYIAPVRGVDALG